MLHKVQGHLGRLIHWKNKEKPTVCRQTASQTDRRRQMGVLLQMCIPAARGVMESLNEAQQECKQNRAKDEARGCLRVGREQEQRTLLLNSLCTRLHSLLCSEQVRDRPSPVGKSRLSHVEEMCRKCVSCTAACQWRGLNLRQRSCQQTIQSSFCGLDEFTQVDVIKVRNLTENRRTLTTLFHHYIIIIKRPIWRLQTVKV